MLKCSDKNLYLLQQRRIAMLKENLDFDGCDEVCGEVQNLTQGELATEHTFTWGTVGSPA
jgi:hypothetical protein